MLLSVGYEGGPIDFIDSMLRDVDGTLLDDDIECADALAIEVEVALERANERAVEVWATLGLCQRWPCIGLELLRGLDAHRHVPPDVAFEALREQ